MSGEIKTPVLELKAGSQITIKPGDYLITARHTLSDILRFAIDQGSYEEVKCLIDGMNPADGPTARDGPYSELHQYWDIASRAESAERKSWAAPEMATIHEATTSLLNNGWRDVGYCPKDGTVFLAWSPLMPAPYRCRYEGDWPNGKWWGLMDGDIWPVRPVLFKLLPILEKK